jgi:hypothetical protein
MNKQIILTAMVVTITLGLVIEAMDMVSIVKATKGANDENGTHGKIINKVTVRMR